MGARLTFAIRPNVSACPSAPHATLMGFSFLGQILIILLVSTCRYPHGSDAAVVPRARRQIVIITARCCFKSINNAEGKRT